MRAICFLFVEPDEITCDFAQQIDGYDVYFILDNNSSAFDDFKVKYQKLHFIQINDEFCKNSGFINANSYWIPKTPSAWDKFFCYFSMIYTNYDDVWVLEEDVFIYDSNAFLLIDQKYEKSDLLVPSNNIKRDNDGWRYWYLGENKITETLYNSMVCACRISNKLFQIIYEYTSKYRELFFIEIMINTLAMHNNLIIDCPDELSTVCAKPMQNRYRILNNKTRKMDWVTKDLPDNMKKYNFYHPVKNITMHKKWRSIVI